MKNLDIKKIEKLLLNNKVEFKSVSISGDWLSLDSCAPLIITSLLSCNNYFYYTDGAARRIINIPIDNIREEFFIEPIATHNITKNGVEINLTIDDLSLNHVATNDGLKYNMVLQKLGDGSYESINPNSSNCKKLFTALHNYMVQNNLK
jgi:hypothetical protein